MLLLVTEAPDGPPLAATHADAGGELLMADARGQTSGLPNGLLGTACGVRPTSSTTVVLKADALPKCAGGCGDQHAYGHAVSLPGRRIVSGASPLGWPCRSARRHGSSGLADFHLRQCHRE
jgi:hypothetical protein